MSKTKRPQFFLLAVAAALCVPIAASYVSTRELARGEAAIARPLSLPASFAGWHAVESKDTIDDADTQICWYENEEGTRVAVMMNRGTIYRECHDLYVCMRVKGFEIRSEETYPIATESGTVNARLIRYHAPGRDHDSLSLLWYDCNGRTLDRKDKVMSMKMRLQTLTSGSSPELRIVRVQTAATADEAKDLDNLRKFAVNLRSLSI